MYAYPYTKVLILWMYMVASTIHAYQCT